LHRRLGARDRRLPNSLVRSRRQRQRHDHRPDGRDAGPDLACSLAPRPPQNAPFRHVEGSSWQMSNRNGGAAEDPWSGSFRVQQRAPRCARARPRSAARRACAGSCNKR
jgi:hypothetical protein